MPDRLSQERIVDPVLTNLAIGYTNAEFVAEVLFPTVSVDKEGGKIPKFGKEHFKIYRTLRAIRAKSNRIYSEAPNTIPYACDEHDLEEPIDYREKAESMFPIEAAATFRVTEGVQLGREKAAADLAQDAANYDASHVETLTGTDQWTDYENSNPITVVDDAKETIRQTIGRRPNVMVIGASTFKALKEHLKLLEKIKYSQKGVLTVDLLKVIFDIPTVAVGEAIYMDDDGTVYDIWGDVCILAYVPQRKPNERTPYEPAYGYTLRRKGYPFVDRYDQQKKLTIIRYTDNYAIKIVGADAAFLIKDTNA